MPDLFRIKSWQRAPVQYRTDSSLGASLPVLAFWIIAAAMTAAALAFVLVPMLRARAPAGPSAREAALEALRGQRRELEADLAAGQLPAQAREEAMAELLQRADQELEAGEARARPTVEGKPWALAAALGVLVPALAFGLYAVVGTPSASDGKALAQAQAQPPGHPDDAQVVAMVESLARKVRERPEDAQGWSLLARSMAALGRFPESAEAYERVSRLVKPDAQLLADWADALGMAQGGKLAGRPAELARQALAIDPRHLKALALAATAAMQTDDRPAAIGYWRRVAETLPAGSTDAAQVAAIIAELGGKGAPGKPAAAAETLTGTVALAPALAAQVKGDETVFVFARREDGPRMPLAVVRSSARSLPLRFTLDDSQAMAPGMTLSSAPAVRVEARISRSGDATAQSGDLVGTSAVVKPGARDVKVVVDKVVP